MSDITNELGFNSNKEIFDDDQYKIRDENGNQIKTKDSFLKNNFNFYTLYSITYRDKVIYLNEKAGDKDVWSSCMPNVEDYVGLEVYRLIFDENLNITQISVVFERNKEHEEIILKIN